jgi:hypothetical protein
MLRGAESSMPIGLRIFGLVAVTFMLLLHAYMLRVTLFSGPYLAADQDQVWVRLGGFRRPRVAVLPWSAVQDVRLHKQSPSIVQVRYVCLYAPSLADEMTAHRDRGIARWARALQHATGTPFAVNIRHADGDAADMVARLKKYATASAAH